MLSSFKAILLLLAFTCLIQAHDEITCNHQEHQEQNPPDFLDVEEDFSSLEEGRVLQSSNYPNIRIHANYDALAQSAPDSFTSYVRNELAPAVISYYQGALRVKYPVSGNLVLGSSVSTLCSLNTPAELMSGVPADYAILFNSKSQPGSVLATSYTCQLASGTKRPMISKTDLNIGVMTVPNGDLIRHEANTYVLMHEMMHTFGFSQSLYKYFVDANGNLLSGHIKSATIGGSTRTVVDVPVLTEKLRAFHGCSTLPGAIMAPGDASHWDKKIYLYETMQSTYIEGKRISELGLGFLEATGWYVVDYSYAEPYFYGQGQGCGFINNDCPSGQVTFDEFCVGNSRGCNYMGNVGSSCSGSSGMGNCEYFQPSDPHNCQGDNLANAHLPSAEVYGRDAGSKCFTGTLSSSSHTSPYSYCFTYNCIDNGGSSQLQVTVGSQTVTCNQQGPMTVDGFYGEIDCPDPLTFCNTVGKQYCPRNCMGRGTCMNNQCQCDSGFAGIDCALVA